MKVVATASATILWLLAASHVFAADISGVVTAVHDGDTFTIDGHTKIRIFGIDAPELNQQCRADAKQEPGNASCVPCGHYSRDALAKLTEGKEVICADRGKSYDRIVGECSIGKVQIGPWMLTHGNAVVYKRFLKKKDRAAYLGAEAGAKRANEGIWATTFVPPSNWRNHEQRLECER